VGAGASSDAAEAQADGDDMNALVDMMDAGDVLSLGRRYRSPLDRLDTLDERWIDMADDASGKWDAAAAAHAVLQDSERLLLVVFHRRTEMVADVAVMAAHTFAVLDREMRTQEASGCSSVLLLWALANIATTATTSAALDFSMIGPPDLPARLRACVAFRLSVGAP
jgi:hypothetical protein